MHTQLRRGLVRCHRSYHSTTRENGEGGTLAQTRVSKSCCDSPGSRRNSPPRHLARGKSAFPASTPSLLTSCMLMSGGRRTAPSFVLAPSLVSSFLNRSRHRMLFLRETLKS